MQTLYRSSEPFLEEDSHNQYQLQFARGTRTFQKLFALWMDSNGWSHPVMTSLVRACLDGARWFHSSQISGLRQRSLLSPGPRIFFAIERLNYFIWLYQTEKKLLPNTMSSNHYTNAFAITEDGKPPEVGWWIEVFLGVRVPKDIDLDRFRFSEPKATELSRRWGRLIRSLCAAQDIDLVDDLPRTIRELYPASEEARINRVLGVIRGDEVWSADDLELELPALAAMTGALGGPAREEDLLTRIG